MTIATQNKWITTEQLMAMPEDGMDRWLIEGELREAEMTKRRRDHSRVEVRIARFLDVWNDTQPQPRGEVLCGEAGIRIRSNPDTTVGVDVAYICAEVAAASPADFPYIDGVPVLMVEVLSPSDKKEDINDKIQAYLNAGVKLVWIVDPPFKTITVYRPDREPELFNVTHSIEAGPEMPGLRIALHDIFER
jgi:Uma2 family endonuclease